MSTADTSAGDQPTEPGADAGLVSPEGTNQDSGPDAAEVPAGGTARSDEPGLLGAPPGASWPRAGTEPEEPESIEDIVPDTPPGPGQQYAAGEG